MEKKLLFSRPWPSPSCWFTLTGCGTTKLSWPGMMYNLRSHCTNAARMVDTSNSYFSCTVEPWSFWSPFDSHVICLSLSSMELNWILPNLISFTLPLRLPPIGLVTSYFTTSSGKRMVTKNLPLLIAPKNFSLIIGAQLPAANGFTLYSISLINNLNQWNFNSTSSSSIQGTSSYFYTTFMWKSI